MIPNATSEPHSDRTCSMVLHVSSFVGPAYFKAIAEILI
jgi:hypothetical protein